ncbi:hypothetical protein M9H77_09644 [Catharanthus roseus]|uniref:Uncharacterized protein n=1 Tax=Catharanthus roseus TaxID=4058 RepID=A0ACC0C172_CATRO|nr:hypothetical protein M9H77_09644 [Catharanthus roseus]
MAAEGSTSSARSTSATADSYIGSLISLTSKSEIRYEGILYNINTEESSIGLRNVRSFGTEGRKKDGPQVLPSDKIYEYILFRGSDIKDLQVKSSPPVQSTPPINSDPAIIQSHYSRPATTSAAMAPAANVSLSDVSPHSAQLGHPGSTFQGGLPLYQPGGNLNSWGPSPPPNANGTGLAMPMYWQGFYGTPNGLPQMHQQSLLRPPPGLSMPPSMPQMQYSGFNTSLPTGAASLPSSNLPEYPSPLLPTTSGALSSSSSLPTSTLPLTVPPLQSATLTSDTSSLVLNKTPVSGTPMSSTATLSSLSPLVTSGQDLNVIAPSISSKSNIVSASVLQNHNISQPITSVAGSSSSILVDTPTPPLVTPGQLLQSGQAPGQLLQSGQASVSLNQTSQTAQKDVEVVQVSTTSSPEPHVPVSAEAQPPILPLPPPARAHKPNGAHFHARNNYRGRGGRGYGITRPVTKFAEDFDFEAMNEKFKKDEVWGHLGKSKKEKEGNDSDEDDYQEEYDTELPKMDVKPIYDKDNFFDSISSNAADNDQTNGRTRFSEQMKIDAETFGEFSRYRGGRGGRGSYRGGRGGRGSYYGRGGYGYGYVPRGRGRGVSNRAS